MNRKIILALTIGLLIPLLTGCFFMSGSKNPVGDTSVANSQQTAQALSSVKPMVMASSYTKPAERKYTFAKNSHSVNHNLKEGIKRAASRLRISLMSADVTDNILITFEKMMVKSTVGRKTNISMPSQKVPLLSATTLSEILAEQELSQGSYNYMEFSVKDAEIVVDGVTFPVLIPSRKIRFVGKFELKDGYSTNLKVKFLHRMVKWHIGKKPFFMLIPVVKISSELIAAPVTEVSDGDVAGSVLSFVDAAKLAGVNVSLDGTAFSAVTDSNGAFSFATVPAGAYTLRASHPDYLDYSFPVEISAGQVASVNVQLNPAAIHSSVGNTGWFSQYFPLADANGEFAEVGLETPVNIDFVSLAFVKAEVRFTAGYHSYGGAARCQNFLASTQQVSAVTDMGGWWVGNTANSGTLLGEFNATPDPGTLYSVDVTELIRSNPSSIYFLASRNLDIVDIRMTNIQLSIYYR